MTQVVDILDAGSHDRSSNSSSSCSNFDINLVAIGIVSQSTVFPNLTCLPDEGNDSRVTEIFWNEFSYEADFNHEYFILFYFKFNSDY